MGIFINNITIFLRMDNSSETDSVTSGVSQASDARSFYNNPQELGIDRRNESKILHLRNFNNWIKSMLISKSSFYTMPSIIFILFVL